MTQPTRNIKLTLEYDGTGLAGWQRQADQPTVQGLLEEALARLTNEKVTVFGAGRTDAGVHAKGQVANFGTAARLSLTDIQRGGNALLPQAVAILSAEEVPADFHARYSAKGKVYDYDLYLNRVRSPLRRNQAWHIPVSLDLDSMAEALGCLIGEHDFAGFQSTGTPVKTTVRRIDSAFLARHSGGLVRITLSGNGFLRHMVRAVVGTLVEVGRGKITPDGFTEILKAADRARAGATAPAHGLCLREVLY